MDQKGISSLGNHRDLLELPLWLCQAGRRISAAEKGINETA
jgi:hypothetical protein